MDCIIDAHSHFSEFASQVPPPATRETPAVPSMATPPVAPRAPAPKGEWLYHASRLGLMTPIAYSVASERLCDSGVTVVIHFESDSLRAPWQP